jgi:hypothetical protein
MLRKTIITLLTLTAMAAISPTLVFAHGGGGGGGGHGGGGGGGHGGGGHFAGGGFHGGGFHGRDIHGFGFFGPFAYGGYYPYDYGYYGDDGCYLMNRRVMTRYGWRIRPVQVCG